ncbi:MAG TPA: S24 family peptidase, partial [Pseudorhizobium sp.]|nr:S24 family peptidase [Pseudorhizobium sp.]
MSNMESISVKMPTLATDILSISNHCQSGKITTMQTTIYDRIKLRLNQLGLTETGAAKMAGLSEGAIRNIRRRLERGEQKVGISSWTAERLSEVLMVPVEWIVQGTGLPPGHEAEGAVSIPGSRAWVRVVDDAEPAPLPAASKSNASFPPVYQRFPDHSTIPVLGQTTAGPNGRFVLNGSEVGRVFTPPMLEGVEGAYAVRVYGTSMEPRYFAGETVWINPREPVRAGDDVIVQMLADGDETERES